MSSMEASVRHLSLLNPSLAPILSGLSTRELVNPIYICVQCTKETNTQQAMASHCRLHVRAGMAKGSVRHIKYNPDHSYTMTCNNPKPRLPSDKAPRSADHVVPPQPPNQINNQVPTAGYSPILAYSGQPFIAYIARSPFLRFNRPNQQGSRQPTVNTDIANATMFTLAFDRETLVRYYPTGCPEIARPGTLFIPVILPKMDLAPRLGPTATADSRRYGDKRKGKKVMSGPWD